MKKYLDWIVSHKVKTGLIVFGLFIIPLIVIHFLYKWITSNYLLQSSWSSGELIMYIAGFEAFIGTVFLGAVAARQNDKANDLNERMLQNEEKRDSYSRQPCLYIKNWSATEITKEDIWKENHGLHMYESLIEKLINVPDSYLLYVIQLNFVNGSNSFVSARTKLLLVNIDNKKSEKLIYLGLPTDSQKYYLQVAPAQSDSISFLIDASFLGLLRSHSCELTLELTNSIGEIFVETIVFSLYGVTDKSLSLFIKSHKVNKI